MGNLCVEIDIVCYAAPFRNERGFLLYSDVGKSGFSRQLWELDSLGSNPGIATSGSTGSGKWELLVPSTCLLSPRLMAGQVVLSHRIEVRYLGGQLYNMVILRYV